MKNQTIYQRMEEKYGTIKKVAEKLEITEMTWHNWKTGKVPIRKMARIAIEYCLDED